MSNCAKCGRGLNFLENHGAFWNKQLKNGYINPPFTMPHYGTEVQLPEYNGKKICKLCFEEIMCYGGTNTRNCINCGFCDGDQIARGIEPAFFGGSALVFDRKYKCRKFSLDINSNNLHSAEKCLSYLTKEEYLKKCLSGEMDKKKEKANIQINLDFSSLKDVMTKGGLVMTTYKCPNCNGMVDIPEAGQVLVCKYCGTSIKPVDIFEKIKSLIQ